MRQQLFKQKQPILTAKVQVPGKLYIAGEYSILHPGNSALILAVNRYLNVTIEHSMAKNKGVIQSGRNQWNYQRTPEKTLDLIELSATSQEHWRYVYAAIEVVETLLGEQKIPILDYEIFIDSHLLDQDGAKYGFGSSGAVTIGIIQGLLQFYGLQPLSHETLFKLAVIAQMTIKAEGSFGDVATSCYGGIILYRSFDRLWLQKQMEQQSRIEALIDLPWKDLRIQPITNDLPITFHFGWTGKPASTAQLVGHLKEKRKKDPQAFISFAEKANQTVFSLHDAIVQKDILTIKQNIHDYQYLLKKLADHYQLDIFTPQLTMMIQIANQLNMAAKPSGAGGGDCGFAVAEEEHPHQTELIEQWKNNGILPLDLEVAPTQRLTGGIV